MTYPEVELPHPRENPSIPWRRARDGLEDEPFPWKSRINLSREERIWLYPRIKRGREFPLENMDASSLRKRTTTLPSEERRRLSSQRKEDDSSLTRRTTHPLQGGRLIPHKKDDPGGEGGWLFPWRRWTTHSPEEGRRTGMWTIYHLEGGLLIPTKVKMLEWLPGMQNEWHWETYIVVGACGNVHDICLRRGRRWCLGRDFS